MKIQDLLFGVLLAGLVPIASGQTAQSTPGATGVASSPRTAERFVELPGGVKDMQAGVVWAKSDNRLDTTWPQAADFCKRKGAGWRLPAASELQALHDSTQSVACGRWTCRASPKFHLSGPWFWSNERQGASEASFVYLTTGARSSTHVGNRNGLQALCVRRP